MSESKANPPKDQSLERYQEAVKRGSEVLPSTIDGSTGDQPPLAVIPSNPAVTQIDSGEQPSGGAGASGSDHSDP